MIYGCVLYSKFLETIDLFQSRHFYHSMKKAQMSVSHHTCWHGSERSKTTRASTLFIVVKYFSEFLTMSKCLCEMENEMLTVI